MPPPTAATGRDNAFRFGALGWSPRISACDPVRGLRPGGSCTPTTGRPASRRPISHYAGGPRPATVFTVHNLAFQGQFPAPTSSARLGLPPQAWSIDGVEYYGGVGFLKAGLQFADRITTVSPDLCAGNPDRRTAAGPRRPAARSRRRVVRHSQRDRRGRLESGDRPDDRLALSARRASRGGPPTRAALQGRFALARTTADCCSAW